MAVGRYISDLEPGDALGPIEYVLSPFVVREYAHANELQQEFFHGGGGDEHYAPATILHLDKLRLYNDACPGGAGPNARLHYEYSVQLHHPIPVGKKLRIQGKVIDRYVKRDRDFMLAEMELWSVEDERLLVSYSDRTLLAYRRKGDAA